MQSLLLGQSCLQSSLDLASFCWYDKDGSLAGMIVLHVDDFLWSGTEDFRQTVIDKVTSTFQSGKQHKRNFQYVGLHIKHLEEGIVSVQSLLSGQSCLQSSLDLALFCWYDKDGSLAEIIVLHVDDFLWSGTKDFKQHKRNFQYVGLDIKHLEEGIVLDQQPYIEGMDHVKISPTRSGRKYDPLNQEEISVLRGMIGQANWAASQSRPDASFDVTDLSINKKHLQVKHLLEANKLIRNLKSEN